MLYKLNSFSLGLLSLTTLHLWDFFLYLSHQSLTIFIEGIQLGEEEGNVAFACHFSPSIYNSPLASSMVFTGQKVWDHGPSRKGTERDSH